MPNKVFWFLLGTPPVNHILKNQKLLVFTNKIKMTCYAPLIDLIRSPTRINPFFETSKWQATIEPTCGVSDWRSLFFVISKTFTELLIETTNLWFKDFRPYTAPVTIFLHMRTSLTKIYFKYEIKITSFFFNWKFFLSVFLTTKNNKQ